MFLQMLRKGRRQSIRVRQESEAARANYAEHCIARKVRSPQHQQSSYNNYLEGNWADHGGILRQSALSLKDRSKIVHAALMESTEVCSLLDKHILHQLEIYKTHHSGP